MPKKYCLETKQRAFDLKKEGKTQEQISEELGVSRTTIVKWLKQKSPKQKIFKAFEEGKKPIDAWKKHDIKKETARKWWRQHQELKGETISEIKEERIKQIEKRMDKIEKQNEEVIKECAQRLKEAKKAFKKTKKPL
ncbi:MAG: Orotate phosphoribosyltransferase-like protein [Candidatus Methanohalarchaeum thermophilum]|uniref:Orotate phosphoribosyltransferase-like protein n=1 Tax=Methanohalarchaeum thermophilum TaxID=1903181 RepID=A0A1Q6DSM4_METT1|nr:MAG: Orotate phosphoribosyltransferase-like protein [Candidatus Methanohalarchaeum thermophilum]